MEEKKVMPENNDENVTTDVVDNNVSTNVEDSQARMKKINQIKKKKNY